MKILRILAQTQNIIVTNMALRVDAMQEYCDDRGIDVNVVDRIVMLSDEQAKNFWLYRSEDYTIPMPDGYDGKNSPNVDYTPMFTDPRWRVNCRLNKPDGSPEDFRGTAYIIDEVQNIWPARGWQGTSSHLTFYLSQHGKLGDTVYFVTQNVKNVDRILYSVAQDFTYCRNHRIEKHGKFRGDNKFSAKTYPGPVFDSSAATMNEEIYTLDLDVAACYDTSAGVGMPGGGTADAGQRAKGLSLKWIWGGIGAAILVSYLIISQVVPMATRGFIAPAIAGQLGKVDKADVDSRSSGPVVGTVASVRKVPDLSAIWVEVIDGRPAVHALLTGGQELPLRSIERYNLEGWPEPWVDAAGVRYYLPRQKVQEPVDQRDKGRDARQMRPAIAKNP
jgi:hypothetical protein